MPSPIDTFLAITSPHGSRQPCRALKFLRNRIIALASAATSPGGTRRIIVTVAEQITHTSDVADHYWTTAADGFHQDNEASLLATGFIADERRNAQCGKALAYSSPW